MSDRPLIGDSEGGTDKSMREMALSFLDRGQPAPSSGDDVQVPDGYVLVATMRHIPEEKLPPQLVAMGYGQVMCNLTMKVPPKFEKTNPPFGLEEVVSFERGETEKSGHFSFFAPFLEAFRLEWGSEIVYYKEHPNTSTSPMVGDWDFYMKPSN